MWSSDRRRLLALLAGAAALAGLAACGFSPAYGPEGGAAAVLGRTEVEAPRNRDEFTLMRRLSGRFGPAEAPLYRLAYRVETDTLGQAITPDNATTRYSLDGTARYALRDAATGAVLIDGQVTSFTSYSATGSTVATYTAEEDARARLMRILADQIVSRLLAGAASLPPPGTVTAGAPVPGWIQKTSDPVWPPVVESGIGAAGVGTAGAGAPQIAPQITPLSPGSVVP